LDRFPEDPRAREAAFAAAHKVLAAARRKQVHVQSHRAIGRLPIGFQLLLQAIALPLLFCGTLLWAEPQVLAFWRDCILFWSDLLDIPLRAHGEATGMRELGIAWKDGAGSADDLPSANMLLATTVVTGAAWIASRQLRGAMLPLRYLLRILAVVQALALAFFWLLPAQFPYTVESHLTDLASMGFVLLVATPAMLTVGYYVLELGLATKIAHTLLILAYFAIMVPHQIVLHVLVLQHLSLLFMPVLYICFGALFDVLVFVALYSWAASKLPAQATSA